MEVSCRDADEQPLTVDGRTEGKFKGQSTDAQKPVKPTITFLASAQTAGLERHGRR